MANDMSQLADLLLKYYMSEDCLPAYFKDLFGTMRGCLKDIETYNSDKTISFRKYLLSYLSLKTAMARGHLFLDLYRVRQGVGKDDYKELTDLLGSMSTTTNWADGVSKDKHPMLAEVYRFGVKEDDGKPYFNNFDDLLIFIRHATQHGPDHTKDGDHKQTVKNLIDNNLIISNHLEDSILELMKRLLQKYQMKDDIFSEVWTHFSKSK
ncbi:hypothetical protein ACP4OV_022719 [Aristida adscensionis]